MSGWDGVSGSLPVASPARTRSAARELLRGRRALALLALGVLVAGTAVSLATQPLLGHLVDLVVARSPASAAVAPAAWIAVVALVSGILTTVGLTLVARLGEEMLASLRERFVDRVLHLPLAAVEQAGSGDLTSRVTNDVSVVGEGVRQALPEFARSLLTIGLTLIGLAVLDWRFLAAALVAVPVQALTVRWYLGVAGPVYRAQRSAVGAQQQHLLETIGGAATVRAFRLAPARLALLSSASSATVSTTLTGVRLQTRFFSRLNLAEYLGLSSVLVVGYVLVRDGSASVGTATAAALYFHSLFAPVNTALILVDEAQSAAASFARLVGVVDLPSAASSSSSSSAPAAVSVAGVHYAYRPGAPVLSDVDLTIAPGRRVALVGASGAGKTTLARLIAGTFAPTRGSVTLAPARPAPDGPAPDGAAPRVALVTQEVHVFAGTLSDDLRLARPCATPAELEAALAAVGALEWASSLPDGLDTVVGDGGHRLSAAQAQHLALARLMLADPAVAILDEATAEAGSAGARQLERAAAAALAGRTGLVVAHRLSQAASADHVVVLDGGRVVEQGTHTELLAAAGRYAALWDAWSAGSAES